MHISASSCQARRLSRGCSMSDATSSTESKNAQLLLVTFAAAAPGRRVGRDQQLPPKQGPVPASSRVGRIATSCLHLLHGLSPATERLQAAWWMIKTFRARGLAQVAARVRLPYRLACTQCTTRCAGRFARAVVRSTTQSQTGGELRTVSCAGRLDVRHADVSARQMLWLAASASLGCQAPARAPDT